MKSLLKEIIISNQERILGLKIYQRNVFLDSNVNHVIVGSRRAGKSYALYQYIQDNFKTNINGFLFINFEDDRLLEFEASHFQLIIEAYQELFDRKPVVFLDEVQNIQYWEKFARRLTDTDYQVFITGSNAQMLSKEIASTLGGRFLIQEVSPLNFEEFLRFNNLELNNASFYSKDKIKIKSLFDQYFKEGGFPELYKYQDKRSYLSNLYKKLLYGDIMVRNSITNEKVMQLLLKKLAESVNNSTSVNRIKNLIKSIGYPIGTATLINYLEYLEDAFLVHSVDNFANKIVDRERNKKYYFVDNGILMLFLTDQDTKLLENITYLHLRRHFDTIYFYKRNIEVDFYLPEQKVIIQVSYSLQDIETEQREIDAIKKSLKELEVNEIFIITYDEEKQLSIDNYTIKVVPIWKWILNYQNELNL